MSMCLMFLLVSHHMRFFFGGGLFVFSSLLLVSNLITRGGKTNKSSSPGTDLCTIYITENWMLRVQKARVSRVSHQISIGAYVAQ